VIMWGMPTSRDGKLSIRLNADVLHRIDNLAGAANVDRAEWVRAWLGHLSNLRREVSLRAMADIPPDRFKGLPGRPVDETEKRPFA
jgi:hypothetical protein